MRGLSRGLQKPLRCSASRFPTRRTEPSELAVNKNKPFFFFFRLRETQCWPDSYYIRPLVPCLLSALHVSYRLRGSCSCAGGFLQQRSSEERADWIWFSLGLHVFGVTSLSHLARFSGHNFPLRWPPYWWLGFLRRSRVKPGGRLLVRSPFQRPVWLTCSVRALLPFLREGKRSAVIPEQQEKQ